jgi:two-component system response regulator DesR
VSLLVVDSHAPSRIGLAAVLKRQAWVGRCLLAVDEEEAASLARRHRPDVVIIDVSRTGPFAGTTVAAIRAAHPGVCLVLSSGCRASLGVPLASIGAAGFLPAGISGEEIVDRVRAALLTGEQFELEPAPSLELTDREREILVLLGGGLTNREIGERLHLGPDSIKKSAGSLYRKLGVRNRTEAVQRAATVLSF